MDWPQNEPLAVTFPLPVLSLIDAVAFTLIEQLEEPSEMPPVMVRVTEVVVPLSDPVSDKATLGSPLKVTPLSLHLLMVSTMFSDAELVVSV
jgi:hypothetical protein